MNKVELAEKVWESIKSGKTKAKKFQDNVLVSFSLISEEPDDNIYVAVKDGELSVAPYRYDDNNCEVEANAEVVARMFAGEISFAKAVEDGFVKVKSGEAAKLMALECLIPSKKTAAKSAAKAADKKPAAKPAAKKEEPKSAEKKAAVKEAPKAAAKETPKAAVKETVKEVVKTEPKVTAKEAPKAAEKAASAKDKAPAMKAKSKKK